MWDRDVMEGGRDLKIFKIISPNISPTYFPVTLKLGKRAEKELENDAAMNATRTEAR